MYYHAEKNDHGLAHSPFKSCVSMKVEPKIDELIDRLPVEANLYRNQVIVAFSDVGRLRSSLPGLSTIRTTGRHLKQDRFIFGSGRFSIAGCSSK